MNYCLLSISLHTQYSAWLLVACLLVAGGISALLYLRGRQRALLAPVQRWVLFGLRTLGLFLLLALMLSPFVTTTKSTIQKPIIVFGIDNSASIRYGADSAYARAKLVADYQAFRNRLGEKYDVRPMLFGDSVSQSDAPDWNGRASNAQMLFEKAGSLFFQQNVGAVVMATDADFNQGSDALSAARQYLPSVPVHTALLGDTAAQIDAAAGNCRFNEIAFRESIFPIEIQVHASRLAGKNLKIRLLEGAKELASQSFKPSRKKEARSFRFQASPQKAGLAKYTIEIVPADGEKNIKNNTRTIYVNVLESKKKLALFADAPHPDIGAIRRGLASNPLFDLECYWTDKLPTNLDCDAAILYQLPSSDARGLALARQLRKDRIPLWVICGQKTDFAALNSLGLGVSVSGRPSEWDDATMLVSSQFSTFETDLEQLALQASFAPLTVPFADITTDAQADVLMRQKIGSVETAKPLWVFMNKEGLGSSILLGEGLWKLRMSAAMRTGSPAAFDAIISKTASFLAATGSKDRFLVRSQPVYRQGEPVFMSAQVYNPSFEPVASAKADITITDSKGKAYSYPFAAAGKQYELDAGLFSPGTYSWKATAVLGQEKFAKQGVFAVENTDIERQNISADFGQAQSAASATGGLCRLASKDGLSQIAESIEKDSNIVSVSYDRQDTRPLASYWLLFAFIALAWAAEWALRKYWGAIR